MSKVADKNRRIVLAVLALAGGVIMAYLVSLHFSVEAGGAFCDLGEGFSCDIVNKSIYAKVLGIPISILGMLYFIGVFGVVLWRCNRSILKKIFLVSIVALGPSLYLTGIELFVLGNICVFCELSKVIIIAILLVSLTGLSKKDRVSKQVIGAVLLAVILGVVTYAIQTNTKPKVPAGKYDTFAECLYEKGLRMYGSVTCSFCERQRKLFGTSFEHINEIECDPRNPDHEAERCIAKDILHTPTWILEDSEGNDLHRFDPGVQSLEKLSEISECELTENP